MQDKRDTRDRQDIPGTPPRWNRRDFLMALTGCTAGLLAPGLLKAEAATPSPNLRPSDRLGELLPLRRLGASGAMVTVLGVGGQHIGTASERDAQAIIEKALEEGVRFFDNAPLYAGGRAEERYGRFLTPQYRDVSFVMTKTLARNKADALKDLDDSLRRMKTDTVDLWKIHSLLTPDKVGQRIEDGILDAMTEAQARGKVKHIGFSGHTDYRGHLRMLDEIEKRGITMASALMPINPADPHFESFVVNVVPRCIEAGVGVLAMKTLAYGRFFGGNIGWKSKDVSVPPAIPGAITLDEVLGFAWSLPIGSLVSGMSSVEQVAQNAALARKGWYWSEAERQKRIDAMAPFAGPDLEFYKEA